MRTMITLLATLITSAAGIAGGTGYQEIPVRDGGSISGTVRFSVELSELKPMKITKDEKWCGTAKPSVRAIGVDGGLANAVVFLEAIRKGKKQTPAETMVLTQAACEFEPHVILLPAGSPLEIVNSDPVLHNVRATDRKGKTVFNIAQPVRGLRFSVRPEKFNGPGTYEVSCDAGHPWMSAQIVVTDHPYYAVTNEHGRFELKDVPEGSYRLRMWHEGIAILKEAQATGGSYRYEEAYEEVRDVIVTRSRNTIVDFLITTRQPASAKK